ncbi:hypothetical protein LQZ24_04790 [Fructobacillus sp. M1-13]|uniref:Uncharacterized protein n=1 Tax=Fructobacillus papyriferae TaxID=2713171 RepID=A0ABS5QQW1_9LACO|nr:hypothetical protein [Fructobacillus papyriferae]MBS9335574.1 hypothetical protein [Fructobacillus papyriferae]MCD2159336.1 hypothetical protein [Fructobacillus papyriferae]
MQAIFDEILDNVLKRVYRVTFYNAETGVATIDKESGEYQYSGYEDETFTNLSPDKIKKIILAVFENDSKDREKHFTIGQPRKSEINGCPFFFVSFTKVQDDDEMLKYAINYDPSRDDSSAWIDRTTGLFGYEGTNIAFYQKLWLEDVIRTQAYHYGEAGTHFAIGCG